mmetsp:Transcript_80908/g.262018  ORF Transcript_80908/g.262018 Transcript_80908/m.262018 type:complete len:264 (+) Transcript_80908:2158-2949(+)
MRLYTVGSPQQPRLKHARPKPPPPQTGRPNSRRRSRRLLKRRRQSAGGDTGRRWRGSRRCGAGWRSWTRICRSSRRRCQPSGKPLRRGGTTRGTLQPGPTRPSSGMRRCCSTGTGSLRQAARATRSWAASPTASWRFAEPLQRSARNGTASAALSAGSSPRSPLWTTTSGPWRQRTTSQWLRRSSEALPRNNLNGSHPGACGDCRRLRSRHTAACVTRCILALRWSFSARCWRRRSCSCMCTASQRNVVYAPGCVLGPAFDAD